MWQDQHLYSGRVVEQLHGSGKVLIDFDDEDQMAVFEKDVIVMADLPEGVDIFARREGGAYELAQVSCHSNTAGNAVFFSF